VKRSTAYILYTALLGVSIACVSSGLVYFPLKDRTFTVSLLAVGVGALLGSLYFAAKNNLNQHDPALKSIRQPAFSQRHPYITVLIVWAVGVALSIFIKWAFMHSTN
jgi:cytochrome bd-type quinol oxidase subunit 2